jgi:AbrB family looped-hinge helix DNA binding protein
MTYKVGPKGQVVIPKAVRDELGIAPGDEVEVETEDGEVRVRPAPAHTRLRGMLAGDDGWDPLGELEAEHRAEVEQDRMSLDEWMRWKASDRRA